MKAPAHCLVVLFFIGLATFVGQAATTPGRDDDDHSKAHNVLYIQTNNAASGKNAVLAYRRDPKDGSLTLFGVFDTKGTGYLNVNQRIGPDDTEQELIISPGHHFLFASNAGSDDISVFRIGEDGRLDLIKHTPFSSGGKQPSSLTLVGHRLYVVNRGDGILPTAVVPVGVTGTPAATNYTGFRVRDEEDEGDIDSIAGSTIVLADGSSPSQLVSSVDGRFLFGDNFLVPDASVTPPAPVFPAARSFLDSLTIVHPKGGLTEGTPLGLPAAYNAAPLILGLRAHPTSNILYGGLVAVGRLGVWSYDASGNLSFVGQESDPNNVGGAGGLCWIAIDPSAQYAYTSSVVPDVIGVLSIKDPLNPKRIQNFSLGGPKAPLPAGTPEPYKFTTAPFNLTVDPSGQFLYVLNDQTCTSASVDPVNCPQGTAIHILQINSDGTLTETPASPLIISPSLVPDHAKGMVVL